MVVSSLNSHRLCQVTIRLHGLPDYSPIIIIINNTKPTIPDDRARPSPAIFPLSPYFLPFIPFSLPAHSDIPTAARCLPRIRPRLALSFDSLRCDDWMR